MSQEGGKMKSKRLFVNVAIALLTAVTAAVPAHATFPGKNGRIAFSFLTSPTSDIYTINPDGSDLQQLTFFAATGGTAQSQSWSPDGSQMVFVGAADAVNGPFQLWIMNSDGSNQHLLLNDPAVYSDWAPSFSPDGRQIVFTRCNAINCSNHRIHADGSDLKSLTSFNADHDIIDWAPVYSPDGGTIAFISFGRLGLIQAIYLMNADGSGIHSFSPAWLGSLGADWSPDGKGIVFFSNDPFDCGVECFPLSSELWTIGVDDGVLTRLTFNNRNWHGINSVPHDANPSWSPQGDAIVFERISPDASTTALYILDRDGGNLRAVMHLPARPALPMPRQNSPGGTRRTKPEMLKLIELDGAIPRWGAAPQDKAHSRSH